MDKAEATFWQEDASQQGSDLPSLDSFPRDLYQNFPTKDPATEYKLWIGTGLSDQLLLAFIVHLFDAFKLDFNRLSIYQFKKYKSNSGNDYPVFGLGLLHPDQIQDHPVPVKINTKQIECAISAWDAFTDPSPDKYIQFMANKDQVMPLLYKAMSSVIYRYPKATNGLSYWDEALLKNAYVHGPKVAMVIGYTLGEDMSVKDPVGDLYLFNRLKNMALPTLKKPLLKINRFDKSMRKTEVQITEFGKLALENKVNVIEENGINDWIGGVHLDAKKPGVWLRDDAKLVFKAFNAA